MHKEIAWKDSHPTPVLLPNSRRPRHRLNANHFAFIAKVWARTRNTHKFLCLLWRLFLQLNRFFFTSAKFPSKIYPKESEGRKWELCSLLAFWRIFFFSYSIRLALIYGWRFSFMICTCYSPLVWITIARFMYALNWKCSSIMLLCCAPFLSGETTMPSLKINKEPKQSQWYSQQ